MGSFVLTIGVMAWHFLEQKPHLKANFTKIKLSFSNMACLSVKIQLL